MKNFKPIPGTNREKILRIALEEFSEKGYKGINITKLAQKADITTGAIYHHFGSKSKLYNIIRTEMEQRIIDRMEGAASLFDDPNEKMKAALLTGLDFSVKQNICTLMSEEISDVRLEKIESFLADVNDKGIPGLDILLLSSWRTILGTISKGELTHEQGINLIKWLFRKGV